MENKMIGFLVSMLLIISFICEVSSYNNYDKIADDILLKEDCSCNKEHLVDVENKNDFSLDCAVMSKPLANLDPKYASPKPLDGDPPDAFSWKNFNGDDWTTPARNQGNCGSCWAFAALGILESIINIREGYPDLDPDLSEQYILSCHSQAGGCDGGLSYKALERLFYHDGIIPEACFPYEADDTIPCSQKCMNWEDLLIPLLDFGFWQSNGSPEDRKAIKNQILQTGPVVTALHVGERFKEWMINHHRSDEYVPYPGHVSWSNHAINIVGWKDDPTIDNGGYWICKNSWGPYIGYEGFFNIEYGAFNIDEELIVWADYDPKSFDWEPVANPGNLYKGNVGEEIVFDASASFDSDGPINLYQWDFGDGATATGKIVSHNYSQRNLYPVLLTVTDEKGKNNTGGTTALINFWKPGDTWTYKFNPINLSIPLKGQHLSFQISGENIVFTVAGETNDSIQVDFKGRIKGEFETIFETGLLPINISGKLLRFNLLKGKVLLRPTDFALQKIQAQFIGIAQEFLNNISIPIPIPFKITVEADLSPPYTVFNIPFIAGKYSYFPPTVISLKVTLSGIFGFIKKSFEKKIDLGAIPYKVIDKDVVSVEAGTFPAYHIFSSLGDIFSTDIYVSPEAGNIVKLSAEINDYFMIAGELQSSNYSEGE